jgi:hypothetical protein
MNFDVNSYIEFARIFRESVCDKTPTNVQEALGLAFEELLMDSAFLISINRNLDIIIDHPIFPPGFLCSYSSLNAIRKCESECIREINLARSGYSGLRYENTILLQ